MLLTYVAFHDFQLPPRRRLICHSRFLKFITLLLPSGSHLSTLAHSTRKTEASEKSDRIVARHTHVCKFHWHLKSFMRSKSRVQLDPGHYDWSILTCLAWCWHMSRFSKHLWRFLGTTEWCFSVEPDHSMATRNYSTERKLTVPVCRRCQGIAWNWMDTIARKTMWACPYIQPSSRASH